MSEPTSAIAGALYVVATPIGNLADLSERARATLASVDLIFAEDTRVTSGLLAHCGLRKPMRALHAHNEARATEEIIALLRAGQSIAIASDAGTPAISDPGARLVRAALDANLRVVPIPGPSAAITALSVAGFEGPFLFLGFLPEKPVARRKALEAVRAVNATLVCYEAPHRIAAAMDDLLTVLGATRRIVVARELTKLFETVRSMPIGEAPAWVRADTNNARGEFVLVIEGAQITAPTDDYEGVLIPLLEALPLSQAVAVAAKITGERRNRLYERALELDRARGALVEKPDTDAHE